MAYETEFSRFLAKVQSYGSKDGAAALAAGSTSPPPEQVTLDAYPAVVVARSQNAGFPKAYNDDLAEELAAVMLWDGSEDVSGDSEEVRFRDKMRACWVIDILFERMPRVLRQFKETSNTDYSISATMLLQVSET